MESDYSSFINCMTHVLINKIGDGLVEGSIDAPSVVMSNEYVKDICEKLCKELLDFDIDHLKNKNVWLKELCKSLVEKGIENEIISMKTL